MSLVEPAIRARAAGVALCVAVVLPLGAPAASGASHTATTQRAASTQHTASIQHAAPVQHTVSIQHAAPPQQLVQAVFPAGPRPQGATGELGIRSIVPAPGSTVAKVPSEIVVTFGSKPAVAIIEAKVGGKALRIPPPVISGTKATAKIPAGSPTGQYTVVVAGTTKDRKVAKQQFTFTVSANKPVDKPKPTPTITSTNKPGEPKPSATKPGQTKPGETKPGQTQPGQTKPSDPTPGQTSPNGTAEPTKPATGDGQPGQTTNPASTAIPGGSDGQGDSGNPALDSTAGDNIPQRSTVPTPVKVLMGFLAAAFFGLLYLSWRNQQRPRRQGPQYDHTPLDQQGKQAP